MRLLLVEDEYALAEPLSERLRREGYAVDLAADGEDGYLQASSGIYDGILLDVMLPRKNGFEVVRQMRAEQNSTPVLLLTAKSETDDKVYGLDCGADDYLTKPFEMQELLARVRALVRRRGEVEHSVLSFGDLELDAASCAVLCTSSGQQMKLPAREYQLLEFFLHNKNQVLSRERIAEKIWGYENEAEYNNVEVYVSFVRKKIAFLGSRVRIRAIRGMGYTLEDPSEDTV